MSYFQQNKIRIYIYIYSSMLYYEDTLPWKYCLIPLRIPTKKIFSYI